MLLKNGQPCEDYFEWKCDHCGALTGRCPVPDGAVYKKGYCGHFVDVSVTPNKTLDLCPECSMKFIRSKQNAAAAEGVLGKFFKPGCKQESPDWVLDALNDDEAQNAPTKAQKEPDVK